MYYKEIKNCYDCGHRFQHFGWEKIKKHGIWMKPGKVYCTFPPKKAVKIDGRYRSKVPPTCPRYAVPATYQVFRLADRSRDTSLLLLYDGPLDECLDFSLFSPLPVPVIVDGFLFHNGKPVTRIDRFCCVTKVDGFTRKSSNYSENSACFVRRNYPYMIEDSVPVPTKEKPSLHDAPAPVKITQYVVFNRKGEILLAHCIYHMDEQVIQVELDAFHRLIKEKGLYTQDMQELEQYDTPGLPLKNKLRMHGWVFYQDGPEFEP